jgi:hypothetical protein
MSIKDNIQAVIDKVQDENNTPPGGVSATADALQRDALAAIAAGQGNAATGQITDAWRTYMTHFAGTPTNAAQLARLLPTDGTANPDFQKERAYLVTNGLCGIWTTDDLMFGNVSDLLDQP